MRNFAWIPIQKILLMHIQTWLKISKYITNKLIKSTKYNNWIHQITIFRKKMKIFRVPGLLVWTRLMLGDRMDLPYNLKQIFSCHSHILELCLTQNFPKVVSYLFLLLHRTKRIGYLWSLSTTNRWWISLWSLSHTSPDKRSVPLCLKTP